MGKKGKKSGSGKKKKGGKKKSVEPQMTWKEALLAYQINIKERQLEDSKYELRAVEDKNSRHKERNERLKSEQMYYMKMLLKQAKEFENKLSHEDEVEKSLVVSVMKNKWEAERQQDNDVAELQQKIKEIEAETLREQRQVSYWLQYRDRGADEHAKQIKLLEQELVDMQISHDEMSTHLKKALQKSKVEITETTETTLGKQKHLASEKAMAKMDKNSRQEVLDNDWLKHEVEIHKREAEELMETVETMERSNLEVMSELFECTVEDLKISRNCFLTQFEDSENLEESGILEMDLTQLAINDLSAHSQDKPLRPRSATQKYVEEKVFSLTTALEEENDEEEDDVNYSHRDETREVDGESQYDGGHERDSDDDDPFNNYFHFDDEDFDDYLQLGPLELKLLNVTGKKMPIYRQKALSSEEMEASKFTSDSFPGSSKLLIK